MLDTFLLEFSTITCSISIIYDISINLTRAYLVHLVLLILADQGQPKKMEEEDKEQELQGERDYLSADHFPSDALSTDSDLCVKPTTILQQLFIGVSN